MTTKRKPAVKRYPLEMVATKEGPKLAWVAHAGKVFAITQEIADTGGDREPWADNWRITHRPSGHAMGSKRFTEETARKWLDAVDGIPEFATATYHDMVTRVAEFGVLTGRALREAGLLEGVQ